MPKRKKIPRGPCCAKVRKAETREIVHCSVKRAPLRKVCGMLSSVKVFICARHLKRADIRDCTYRTIRGGGEVDAE